MIFDTVNCSENQESRKKLFQLIESGDATLFTGLGISLRLKYPSWEGAIEELSKMLPNEKDRELVSNKIQKGELLTAAQIIKNGVTISSYNTAFEKLFELKNPSHDDFHQLLVSLNFKGFVTTNYDPIIESALRKIQNPSAEYGIIISKDKKSFVHDFLHGTNKPEDFKERFHLYLHGKYNIPDSTILSYGDYVQKYDGLDITHTGELYEQLINGSIGIEDFESQSKLKDKAFRTLHYKTIYMLFASHKLVFVGFGLRDEYLNKIIDDIYDDFNPFYSSHFALLSSNYSKKWTRLDYSDNKRKWKEKGVELVFYEDDDLFGGIDRFFNGLSSESYYEFESSQFDKSGVTLYEKNSKEQDSNIEDGNEEINKKLISNAKKIAENLKRK